VRWPTSQLFPFRIPELDSVAWKWESGWREEKKILLHSMGYGSWVAFFNLLTCGLAYGWYFSLKGSGEIKKTELNLGRTYACMQLKIGIGVVYEFRRHCKIDTI